MSKYIKVKDAIEAAINGCASWDGGYFPSMDDPIKEEFDAIADKRIELVRCGECRWACLAPQRQTATCMKKRLPSTHDYEYFCADGERKDNDK